MPQIWMTYQEMAEEGFATDAIEARSVAIAEGLRRKRSSDGLSRVLLPPSLADLFVIQASSRNFDVERLADILVARLRKMQPPRLPPAVSRAETAKVSG